MAAQMDTDWCTGPGLGLAMQKDENEGPSRISDARPDRPLDRDPRRWPNAVTQDAPTGDQRISSDAEDGDAADADTGQRLTSRHPRPTAPQAHPQASATTLTAHVVPETYSAHVDFAAAGHIDMNGSKNASNTKQTASPSGSRFSSQICALTAPCTRTQQCVQSSYFAHISRK